MDQVLKDKLIEAAWKARENAYTPYSNYMVGAAVLGEDGNIYTGCNIENASYGLTVCAERTAMFKMVSEGCRHFTALVCVTGTPGVEGTPCLACRQVMTEFCVNDQVPVIDVSPDGSMWEHTIAELCPFPFVAFEKNEDYHA